ncbi:MAG: gamma-glutamylcyclotransferase [Candidatus Eisenbacteria bacterium]|nr:gamma-glutamylcyclotransferase [Candidatus Eisenbacteria bacterium]
MLYFAYGSNLDPEQMRERCPRHRVVGLAALHDHRLVFPLFSNRWGGGVASVQPAHIATVWGMLFELDDDDLRALDGYEGFRAEGDPHNIYDRVQVTVELVRPDDGSVPRRIRVATYLAHPANPQPPSRRYLDAILRGARHHRLPEEYLAALAAVKVAPEEVAG